MNLLEIIAVVVLVMWGLPIIAYLVAKFATAGFLRARRRDEQRAGTGRKEERRKNNENK